MVSSCAAKHRCAPVLARISSGVTPGAIAVTVRQPGLQSMMHSSVTIVFTQPGAVSGSEQCSTIFASPFFVQCSMALMTFLAPLTMSIAPPMPLSFFPGIFQLARLQASSTCSAPSTVASRWPPRAMANAIVLSKQQAPGMSVMTSPLALHRSLCTVFQLPFSPAQLSSQAITLSRVEKSHGKPPASPAPTQPFSAWNSTVMPSGT